MIFRFARHTKNLGNLKTFYTQILGFEILGEFKDHDGYNGIFLGKKDQNWHLEFTENNECPTSKFDEDDLLVFYPTEISAYEKILYQLEKFNIPLLNPKNPYWKANGICFEDSDHYKIIVSKQKII